MKKFCKKCGKEYKDETKFCKGCGATRAGIEDQNAAAVTPTVGSSIPAMIDKMIENTGTDKSLKPGWQTMLWSGLYAGAWVMLVWVTIEIYRVTDIMGRFRGVGTIGDFIWEDIFWSLFLMLWGLVLPILIFLGVRILRRYKAKNKIINLWDLIPIIPIYIINLGVVLNLYDSVFMDARVRDLVARGQRVGIFNRTAAAIASRELNQLFNNLGNWVIAIGFGILIGLLGTIILIIVFIKNSKKANK